MLRNFRQSLVTRFKSVVGKSKNMSSAAGGEALPDRYSGAMQVMHWTMGGSIIACVGLVQYAQYKKGQEKMDIMFYHKSFGVLAAGLIGPRILLRLTSKIPAPVPGPTWEVMAAKATHAMLYAFMIFMPVSGVVMGYYGGKGLPFFWTTVPGASKADGKIAKSAFENHKLIGHYAQYLIPAHVGGAALHYVARGKNILPRIFSAGK